MGLMMTLPSLFKECMAQSFKELEGVLFGRRDWLRSSAEISSVYKLLCLVWRECQKARGIRPEFRRQSKCASDIMAHTSHK
jgi:hypothetical protein